MKFPLPEGTIRTVRRPNREPNRVVNAKDAVRMVMAALRNGYSSDEICEAIASKGGEACKPECEELKRKVDDWLREVTEIKSKMGILDEFVRDILE